MGARAHPSPGVGPGVRAGHKCRLAERQMEAPDIILVKITMANVPSSSPKFCSAETPNNHTRDSPRRMLPRP